MLPGANGFRLNAGMGDACPLYHGALHEATYRYAYAKSPGMRKRVVGMDPAITPHAARFDRRRAEQARRSRCAAMDSNAYSIPAGCVMPQRDIVVIGASAGGVGALKETVERLRPDIRASFFIVLHFPPFKESHLPQILSRVGPLPADHPNNGDPIQPGHIYVAPPDRHLLVRDGRIQL
jgi:chemotaxis response regulator CheB